MTETVDQAQAQPPRTLANSFSLAGYWGSGLSVITGRRHLQAA